jgi:hypothetical protein
VEKHGTCAQNLFNEHGYFQAALCLHGQLCVLDALSSAGISPDGGYYTWATVKDTIQEGRALAMRHMSTAIATSPATPRSTSALPPTHRASWNARQPRRQAVRQQGQVPGLLIQRQRSCIQGSYPRSCIMSSWSFADFLLIPWWFSQVQELMMLM